MSTEPKTRAAMAQATTERLLAVAQRSFAELGFHAVSLDAVSAEAGVTRGALHHHFTNKTGLFEAVLRQIDRELGIAMQEVWDAEPDRWIGFRRCYHVYLDQALRQDRCRILFQDAPAVLGMKALDILMESGLGETVEDLDDLMAAGRITPMDPTALAHLLHGAAINLAFWVAEGSADDDRMMRAHATITTLFDGMTRSGGPA
jgi:AcrR family transcriptional regulator